VKTVFVDTSGFYAALNADDPFHRRARDLLLRAEAEQWRLITTNYVVQETWALIQARLGWDAVEAWHRVVLPRCEIVWIDEALHKLGAARCRQAGERRLSLTDCVSFEVMHREHVREAVADDEHFAAEGFGLPR
jgi:predicted nucleic acid-binding protein